MRKGGVIESDGEGAHKIQRNRAQLTGVTFTLACHCLRGGSNRRVVKICVRAIVKVSFCRRRRGARGASGGGRA
jgi:hypothetical protein